VLGEIFIVVLLGSRNRLSPPDDKPRIDVAGKVEVAVDGGLRAFGIYNFPTITPVTRVKRARLTGHTSTIKLLKIAQ